MATRGDQSTKSNDSKFAEDKGEKASDDHVEVAKAVSVDEHGKIISNDGFRIDGDGEDHMKEPPMTITRLLSLVAMAFLWTGSQIPVYLFGAVVPYIYGDIGGVDRWVWLVLGNLLALAAICPFVGSLSDLMGRRYVALTGAMLIIIGVTVSSTAHNMNIFIAGMTLSGAGAGINELTALSVTSELAPTSKRGQYVAICAYLLTSNNLSPVTSN